MRGGVLLALVAFVYATLCNATVIFTDNTNAVELNWKGPFPSGWLMLARISADVEGGYYTFLSNWDSGSPYGTAQPACTDSGGVWLGYLVSNSSAWTHSAAYNTPGYCTGVTSTGTAAIDKFTTGTEFYSGIEYIADIFRPYLNGCPNTCVIGTNIPIIPPTNAVKTYIFANAQGTIRDIAFINSTINPNAIDQYTSGALTVDAATPGLMLWYPLDAFFDPTQPLSSSGGYLSGIQLSFVNPARVLLKPTANCNSAPFLSGSGCIDGGGLTSSTNIDGSQSFIIAGNLALLPDSTVSLDLNQQIIADGFAQLAGALQVTLAAELTTPTTVTLVLANNTIFGTFTDIRIRSPEGCTYSTTPTYGSDYFDLIISPGGCPKSSSKTVAIVGGVVGGAAGLAIILIIVAIILIKKKPHLAAKLGMRSKQQRGSITGGKRSVRDINI